jgi:hypothetical protein
MLQAMDTWARSDEAAVPLLLVQVEPSANSDDDAFVMQSGTDAVRFQYLLSLLCSVIFVFANHAGTRSSARQAPVSSRRHLIACGSSNRASGPLTLCRLLLQTIQQFVQELSDDATRSMAVRGAAQDSLNLLNGDPEKTSSSEAEASGEEGDGNDGIERPAKRSRT